MGSPRFLCTGDIIAYFGGKCKCFLVESGEVRTGDCGHPPMVPSAENHDRVNIYLKYARKYTKPPSDSA